MSASDLPAFRIGVVGCGGISNSHGRAGLASEKIQLVACCDIRESVARDWSDGDRAELTLAMPIERVMPHPDIRQTAGQTALQRGPLVYCLEEVDNGPRLANVCIPQDSELDLSLDSELFGGVAVITGKALRIEPAEASSALYRHHSRASYAESEFIFKAIPYYLWANRDPGEMRVWIRSS